MNTNVQLKPFGAGGKSGCRVIDHLTRSPASALACVENGERGLAFGSRLRYSFASPILRIAVLC